MRFWIDGKINLDSEKDKPGSVSDILDLSQWVEKSSLPEQKPVDEKQGSGLTEKQKLTIILLERFIKMITGKDIKIDIFDPASMAASNGQAQGGTGAGNARAGWGLQYDSHELYREQESVEFSATGKIETADGRKIEFSFGMSMSREFVQENRVQIRAGDGALVDPLVINYDGRAAKLTQVKYSFDLNMDGKDDLMPFLQEGSGFLALDKNGDGKINDGSELFGPSSGNGFSELAAYDDDRNGWIDEGDAVFQKLRVWVKDNDGNDRYFSLKELGIGAIYLDYVSTPFTYKDQDNSEQGQLQRTGLYLKENGGVGSVQQIDLVV